MKNILICMQQMGIGGVETVVLNQIQVLKDKGNNVFVMGLYGEYAERYEKFGAKCINREFKLEQSYDINAINSLKDFLINEQITEVHVHSIECIPYIFPASILTKVPYIAYVHGGYMEVYEWYINNYYIYKSAFELYFNNAYKIICITQSAKNNIINLFNIYNDNFEVKPNSLYFNNLPPIDENEKNTKNKILVISRISKEKQNSVMNAIKFFQEYKKINVNSNMSILGEGNAYDEVKKYVYDMNLKNEITFLGKTNDVYSVIKDYDIIMGMGRCMLEAIAMKKIAIISGYKNITGIVDKGNIKLASEENFTDRYEKDDKKQETLNKLFNLSNFEIQKILQDNYKYAYDNLNYEKNIIEYNKESEYKKPTLDNIIFFKVINEFIEQYNNMQDDFKKEKNNLETLLEKSYKENREVYKIVKEDQKKIQDEMEKAIKEREKLQEENELIKMKNEEIKRKIDEEKEVNNYSLIQRVFNKNKK